MDKMTKFFKNNGKKSKRQHESQTQEVQQVKKRKVDSTDTQIMILRKRDHLSSVTPASTPLNKRHASIVNLDTSNLKTNDVQIIKITKTKASNVVESTSDVPTDYCKTYERGLDLAIKPKSDCVLDNEQQNVSNDKIEDNLNSNQQIRPLSQNDESFRDTRSKDQNQTKKVKRFKKQPFNKQKVAGLIVKKSQAPKIKKEPTISDVPFTKLRLRKGDEPELDLAIKSKSDCELDDEQQNVSNDKIEDNLNSNQPRPFQNDESEIVYRNDTSSKDENGTKKVKRSKKQPFNKQKVAGRIVKKSQSPEIRMEPTNSDVPFVKMKRNCDSQSSVSPTSSTTLHKELDVVENIDISNFKTNNDRIMNIATTSSNAIESTSNLPTDNKLNDNEPPELDSAIEQKSDYELDDEINYNQNDFNESFRYNVNNLKQESLIDEHQSPPIDKLANNLNTSQRSRPLSQIDKSSEIDLIYDKDTSSKDSQNFEYSNDDDFMLDNPHQQEHIDETNLVTPTAASANFDRTTTTSNEHSVIHSTDEQYLSLDNFELLESVILYYRTKNINCLMQWQYEALHLPGVLEGTSNLIFSAPTSAGKTIVADILMIRKVLKKQKKGLVILPYISLANEKVTALESMLKYTSIEVGGFMGNSSPSGRFPAINIAVCTIEKANNIINRLVEEGNLDDLGIVVVDELHELGAGERGCILEQTLCKLKFYREYFGMDIQIVGMSATLPNLNEMAKWLNAESYLTEHRPIPLQEMVMIGDDIIDVATYQTIRTKDDIEVKLSKDRNYALSLTLETIRSNNGALVFCETKKKTEELAQTLSNTIQKLLTYAGDVEKFMKARDTLKECLKEHHLKEIIEQLSKCPAKLDEGLASTIPSAVAFHHAGLSMDERDIIELGFKEGTIKVIFATPTLSSGVNLPARRVIINTAKTGIDDLNPLTYRQMTGRAGRKGIDTIGESIIISKPDKSDQDKIRKLVSSTLEPIRSRIIKLENGQVMISEGFRRFTLESIATGMVTTFDEIKNYLSCGLFPNQVRPLTDEEIQKVLENLTSGADATIQKIVDNQVEKYVPSKLGQGILASSFSPDQAIQLKKQLETSMKALSLDCDLHLLYHVIPNDNLGAKIINWNKFFDILSVMDENSAKFNVARLLKIDPGYVNTQSRTYHYRKEKQQVDETKVNHIKFYYALALNEIVEERTLKEVSKEYCIDRGDLQMLQIRSSSHCAMISTFCMKLGWKTFSVLMKMFQDRLYFGISQELVELMNINCLSGQMARSLYNAGFEDIKTIANSSKFQIEKVFVNYAPENADMKRHWISTKCRSMTDSEISELIIKEARQVIEDNSGRKFNWGDNSSIGVRTVEATPNRLRSNSNYKVNNKTKMKVKKPYISPRGKTLNKKFRSSNKKSMNNNTGRQVLSLNGSDKANNSNAASQFVVEVEDESMNSGVLDEIGSDQLSSCADEIDTPKQSNYENNFNTNSQSPACVKRNVDIQLIETDEEMNQTAIEDEVDNFVRSGSAVGNVRSTVNKLNSKLFYKSSYNLEVDEKCFRKIDFNAYEICDKINKNELKTFMINQVNEENVSSFVHKLESTDMFIFYFKLETMTIQEKDFLTNETKTAQDVRVKADWLYKIQRICFLLGDQKIYCFNSNQMVQLLKRQLIESDFAFRNPLVTGVCYDAKVGYKLLKCCIEIGDQNLRKIYWHDPKVAHWMLNPDAKEPSRLLDIAPKYLDVKDDVKANYLKLIDNGTKEYRKHEARLKERNRDVEIDEAVDFESFATTLFLYPVMSKLKHLLKEKCLYESYINIELPVLIVFAQMELKGFTLDEEYMKDSFELWTGLNNQLEKRIHERLVEKKIKLKKERELNVREPSKVKEILHKLGLYSQYQKETNLPRKVIESLGTGKEILDRMRLFDPLAGWISDSRKLLHLIDSRCNLKLEMDRLAIRNQVIGTYKHFMATGRIAMVNPNLLGIDKDSEMIIDGKHYKLSLKKVFIARLGYILLTADYCQLELRILAALSKEANLIQVFNLDKDPFKIIAARIKRKDTDQITEFERNSAKQLMYATIYGQGLTKLAEKLGVGSEEVARDFLKEFHDAFPNLKSFVEQSKEFARKNGYIETLFGRRRYLPNINSSDKEQSASDERKAVNSRIQGSASDLVKLTMLKLDQALDKTKVDAEILLQIHDELVFQVRNDEQNLNDFTRLLVREMNSCGSVIDTKLPIRVKKGPNWSDMSEFDTKRI